MNGLNVPAERSNMHSTSNWQSPDKGRRFPFHFDTFCCRNDRNSATTRSTETLDPIMSIVFSSVRLPVNMAANRARLPQCIRAGTE